MLQVILLFCLLLCTGISASVGDEKIKIIPDTTFIHPTCTMPSGTPVFYYSGDHSVFKKMQFGLGFSAVDAESGRRLIVYDRDSNALVQSFILRNYIFLHECGHHVLGHFEKNSFKNEEIEADCYAMMRLHHEMYFSVDVIKRQLFPILRRFPAGKNHPSGEIRTAKALECLI